MVANTYNRDRAEAKKHQNGFKQKACDLALENSIFSIRLLQVSIEVVLIIP